MERPRHLIVEFSHLTQVEKGLTTLGPRYLRLRNGYRMRLINFFGTQQAIGYYQE